MILALTAGVLGQILLAASLVSVGVAKYLRGAMRAEILSEGAVGVLKRN